jgi:hypothetical protein
MSEAVLPRDPSLRGDSDGIAGDKPSFTGTSTAIAAEVKATPTPESTPAAPTLSIIAQGKALATEQATAPPGPADPFAIVPEKHRVFAGEGDAKKLDPAATLAKVSNAYVALEKKLGAGAVGAPATPDDYTITIPEAFKDQLDPAAIKDNAEFKDFIAKMHGIGLTQPQLDTVLGELIESVVGVASDKNEQTFEQAKAALEKVWTSPAEFQRGSMRCWQALTGFCDNEAQANDLLQRYGNDAQLVQFLAKVGAEMGEDRSLAATMMTASGEDVDKLRNSPAYWDENHPEHKATVARVTAYYNRNGTRSTGRSVGPQIISLG